MSLQNGDFVVYFFEGGEYMTICNFYSGSEAETESFAQKFAEKLKHGDLVAFFGDLGAGKTAFVRGAVSYLCPEALVCSPTYAVINEYKGAQNTVCHFDLYRIHCEYDLLSIVFDDYSTGGGDTESEVLWGASWIYSEHKGNQYDDFDHCVIGFTTSHEVYVVESVNGQLVQYGHSFYIGTSS